MDMFRITGKIGRRDYADIWSAVLLLVSLYLFGDGLGYRMPLVRNGEELSLELLPALASVLIPLLASGWCVFAASLRRCRDAGFPPEVFLGLAIPLVIQLALGVCLPYPDSMAAQILKAIAVFEAVLLVMLCAALATMKSLSLSEPPPLKGTRSRAVMPSQVSRRGPRFGRLG